MHNVLHLFDRSFPHIMMWGSCFSVVHSRLHPSVRLLRASSASPTTSHNSFTHNSQLRRTQHTTLPTAGVVVYDRQQLLNLKHVDERGSIMVCSASPLLSGDLLSHVCSHLRRRPVVKTYFLFIVLEGKTLSFTHTSLPHAALSHTTPSHMTLSHTTPCISLQQSILHHLLCLSCLLPTASTTVCSYWKKLTCGVIRSFNFLLFCLHLPAHWPFGP